jgi:formate/nitrite transporter FocA (FNT family)
MWQPLVKLLESGSYCNPTVTPALKISLSISKAEEKTIIEVSIVTTFFFMGLGYWIRKSPHVLFTQILPFFSQINFVYIFSMVSEQSLSQWQRGRFSNPPPRNS